MKTKHILTAMVLPAMFAACTAEEIVENNNVAANVNRTQVEAVTFAANGEADSRLVWDEETGKFAWEDTDKFLLFPADDGTTVNESTSTTTVYPGGRFAVGSTLVTGYEYEKGEDGTYTTKAAQMGEGLWWGYAPSFEKKARGLVGYEISTSQDADYYMSEAAQAFITPMYEISSLNYNNKLPLEMMNFYSTVIIPLTNNTKEDMTLNQIVLELQGDDYFVTKGLINIGAMSDFIVAYDGEKWDDYKNLNASATDNRKAGKLMEDMRKTYLVKEYTDAEDGEKSQVIMLNLKGDVLEAGETKEYRMLVPAANGKVSFNIIVLAKEGYKEITAASQSNYMYNTNIYHNGEKAAFGRKDGVAKAYSIKNLVDEESNRYYVASKEELLEKIYEVNGTFTAVKVGTWNIDSEIAEAIAESDSYVIFEGDYTVADEVASRTADEEDKGIELSKVAFKNEVTVLEGNKVTFVESTIGENELMAGAKLIIAEGAEVVIEDGIFAGEIENEGTLTVEATVPTLYDGDDVDTTPETATINNISNKGTLTLKGNDHKVSMNGGTLTYTAVDKDGDSVVDAMAVSKLNLAAALANNITVNVGEKVTLNLGTIKKAQVVSYNATTEAVDKTMTLVNNGVVALTEGYTNLWNLTNAGEVTGAHHLILNGNSSTNTGDIEVRAFDVMKDAKITNEGDITVTGTAANFGEIVAKEGSYIKLNRTWAVTNEGQMDNTVTNKGRIDNTDGGNLDLGTGVKDTQVIYHKFTADFNLDDMAALKVGLHNLNAIVVDGAKFTWGFAAEAKDYSNCANILRAELLNGSEFYVPACETTPVTAVDTYFETIYVSGSVKMSGWSAEKSVANANGKLTTGGFNIEMAKAATLTFERITFNATTAMTFVSPTLLATDVDTAAEKKSNCAKVVVKENADVNFGVSVAFKNAAGTATVAAVAEDYSDVTKDNSIHLTNVNTTITSLTVAAE